MTQQHQRGVREGKTAQAYAVRVLVPTEPGRPPQAFYRIVRAASRKAAATVAQRFLFASVGEDPYMTFREFLKTHAAVAASGPSREEARAYEAIQAALQNIAVYPLSDWLSALEGDWVCLGACEAH